MVKLSKKSKRVSCARRYSIAKKVRDHNKKMRKEARKHPEFKKKKSKDIKIPKLAPFKDELLKQAEEAKQQLEQERQLKKQQRSLARQQQKFDRPKSFESMMNDVEHRRNVFDYEQISNDDINLPTEIGEGDERSRKTYYREFKKVVDASDIIIQVLDARDPLGCRCPQVEQAVLTSGKNKKLILLINKIDLIPRDNLDKWLKYLRNEFPTIAFRSSTQNQRDRLGHVKASLKACDEHLLKSSNKCIGASTLMSLLSNYCRKHDIKTSITVGIVGFPNVGKSSVINSLKRSQACETGSMPGITKQMQTVKLDKLIKLFDSPGIVMSKETNPASLVLRNCIRIETIENPVPAIELLLNRCSKEQMMLQYNLSDFQDVNEFLSKIALKMGSLKKGGIPDINKAAQRVLTDWTNGKLTYFTEPPERTGEILSTELVTQMKEAFDIDGLLRNENEQLKDLQNVPITGISLPASTPTPTDMDLDEDSSAEEMNEDDNGENHQPTIKDSKKVRFMVQVTDKSKRLSKQQASDLVDKEHNNDIRRSVKRSNLVRQQEFKKMKKNQKRTEKSVSNLGDALDSMVRLTTTTTTDDSYNFQTDFV
jgi:nuclear GTP-binding protein